LILVSVMKIAITCWHGRVSPVLDVASRAILVTVDRNNPTDRREVTIEGGTPRRRAQHIVGLGADIVICGAVSRSLEFALQSAGVEVIAHICGQVDEVLDAFVCGRLDNDVYLMPGCCRQRTRFRGGGHVAG